MSSPSPSSSKSISEQEKPVDPEHLRGVSSFLDNLGNSAHIPDNCTTQDFYSDLLRGMLKVKHISRGRISCSFRVIPAVTNFYNGLHGGAVALIAERVATACVRTVVAEGKEIFMGELSLSYLSAAPPDVELIAEASLVKSGRNVTVISIEIRLKETAKLAYIAHATFFNTPMSKL